MRKIFLIVLILVFGKSYADDSTNRFTLAEFMKVVKTYHPMARQAGIQVEKAKASQIAARAGFDPVAEAGGGNKTFDGLNYYQSNYTQISIPTWYGIEVSTGIEYLGGNRLDPQQTGGQTSFAGLSIPLAKNLLMDKRRAALRQARILVNSSEQERRALLNDLMLDAADAYWKWVEAYLVYTAYENLIAVNQRRLSLVKLAYVNGERPAIDTTEALTQLQQFEYLQNNARLGFENTTVILNAFLWRAGDQPYSLPREVIPAEKHEQLADAVVFPELNSLVDQAKANHPALVAYNFKLDFLNVERRLKFQELLPKLDLKYNQLGKGYDIASTATKTLFDNNYRFGLNFSVPLRLSQGRGEYKLAKLKIEETRLQLSQKQVEIIAKVKQDYNQLQNYKLQVNLLQRTYQNYLRLQRGEETRFFNGESSLFLVNSRENKVIETLIKLIETTIAYNKTAQTLQWSAGQLWQF